MIAAMTHDEIEQLLLRAIIGRIGCNAEGRTCVVPIRYATMANRSTLNRRGLKLRTMCSNPNVCFELDDSTLSNVVVRSGPCRPIAREGRSDGTRYPRGEGFRCENRRPDQARRFSVLDIVSAATK